MLSQKITVPTEGANTGFTANQTYTYDTLNRLQSATETVASAQTWKQTFQYDRYGNRTFDTSGTNTTTLGSSFTASAVNPTISTTNNRLSSGQGYSYDANGNLTQDTNNSLLPNYVYDAEGRQTAVQDASQVNRGEYQYDGEGRRVRKLSAAEETIFVYDGAGQLAAEYSTVLATTPQVSYPTTDHLGSPRIVTDQNGAITSRKDFDAYGQETFTSQRTTGLHYLPTTQPREVRQDYTGYQKDEESGLEYAQARYYNPAHGRFTSVDPLTASANVKDPQTFNRYTYALNSPYKLTDPLGLVSQTSGSACGQWCRNTTGSLDGGQIDGSSFSSRYELPHTGLQDEMQSDHDSDVARLARQDHVTAQIATPPPLLDDEVPESSAERAKYNCLAWALGFTDVWIEPIFSGKSGRREGGYIEIKNRESDTTGNVEYLPMGEQGRSTLPFYSMLDVAKAFGAKEKVKVKDKKIEASADSETPAGYYKMVVFEDQKDFTKTHVMRQDADGTWSSKDGNGIRFTGIKDPEKHFKQGPNVVTTYLFRETKKLGKR